MSAKQPLRDRSNRTIGYIVTEADGRQRLTGSVCRPLIRSRIPMLVHVRVAARLAAPASRTIQELLGHKDVETTMIYTHVLNKPGLSVKSPAD